MTANDIDPIDALFRKARESEPYLEDAGFTDRVKTVLRARRRLLPAPPTRWQLPILLLGALLGSLVCYQTAPVQRWTLELLQWLNSGLTLAAIGLTGIVIALAASLALANDRI